MTRSTTPSICLKSIQKAYGATVALDGVTLELKPGEVHALLGENGAGKTTLMKTLFGLTQPDSGSIEVNGIATVIASPRDARAAGIGMVTQHFSLVKTMTVAENLALAEAGLVRVNLAEARRTVEGAAARYGLEAPADAVVAELPVALQQRVEILKALAAGCKYLILDEPTAVLGPKDVDSLLGVIARLRDQESMSIVLISHKMKEIERVANRVSVLRRGSVVASTAAEGMTPKQLVALMVGGDGTEPVVRTIAVAKERAAVVLALRGISIKRVIGGLDDVSLEVREGEILGVAGVSGNGQSELVGVLSGILRADSGNLEVAGSVLGDVTPSMLYRAGVGMLGEDRHASAVQHLPVVENLVLDQLQTVTRLGHLDRGAMAQRCETAIREFEIKATPDQHLGTLSGGNMQKVLLARLFSRSPKAVIVSQPTRGLDVVSTRYVRSLIAAARDKGTAVVLVSEDLDEVLELADRVAVMYRGRVVGIVHAHGLTRERLGEMMAGVS